MRVFNMWRSDGSGDRSTEKLDRLERTLTELQATVSNLASEEGGRARAMHERGETLDVNVRSIQEALARLTPEEMNGTGQPDGGSDSPPDSGPSSRFKREPLAHVNGIPVFASSDRYVENYQKIAADHVAAMKPGAANPWIPDALWEEIERSTIDLVREHSRSGQCILDVGVGLGRLLARLDGLERHGVDISFEYLRTARETGVNVAFAKAEDLPYADATFDVLVCTDVLEHVFDLNRCCSEMLRVLRPGGTLIVRVPLEEALDPYLSEQLPYDFVHVRSFSLAGLKLLFTKVFECAFVASMTTGAHLQGPDRVRFRALPKETIRRLRTALPADTLDMSGGALKTMLAMSEDEIVDALHDMRDTSPALFSCVAEEVVTPLEVNAVFRKSHGILRRSLS